MSTVSYAAIATNLATNAASFEEMSKSANLNGADLFQFFVGAEAPVHLRPALKPSVPSATDSANSVLPPATVALRTSAANSSAAPTSSTSTNAASTMSAAVATSGAVPAAQIARTPPATPTPVATQSASVTTGPVAQNLDNTLSTVPFGNASVEYVVTAAHGLFTHADGGPWTRIGGDGSIASVSAVRDYSGNLAAFVVTQDRGLFEYSTANGWQLIGAPGTIRAISAGTDSAGAAEAYVLTTGGAFTVYRSDSGWSPSMIGAPGTILQFSASRNDKVAVVTSNYAVAEYSSSMGWQMRTSANFAYSVSAAPGGVTIYAVGVDRGLYRYAEGGSWVQFGGANTIGSVTTGTDASGNAQAFVLTASGSLYELNSQQQWIAIGAAGSVQLIRGADQGAVVVVTADRSLYEYSDQSGWAPLTGAGFAIGNVSGPTLTAIPPDFTTFTSGQTITIQVSADDPNGGALQAAIDIDLKGDGSFRDPGDMNAITGPVQVGANSFALPSLPQGTYAMEVRVTDSQGNQSVSPIATMVVNPYAGILGSQPLQQLYGAYLSAINVNPPAAALGVSTKSAGVSTSNIVLPQSFFTPFLKAHFVFDPAQRVEIDVRSTLGKYLGALQSELQAQGMLVMRVTPAQNLITGYLPIGAIGTLTSLPHYDAALPVLAPMRSVGAVTSQGVAVINANNFVTQTGVDGTGVKIGAISDSVNQFDGGIASSQRTGDLPPTVQVLQDGPPGSTDEGRAMLEIIHDVAPGAALAFDTAGNTPQDMANAILALAGVGSNVITDDVQFFDEPMFNDGVIAQAVDTVFNQGVFYTSSAGNNSNHGFLAPWVSTAATVGGVTGTFENLGNGSVLQSFTLPVGETVMLAFEWDSAYLEGGSPLPNFQVPNTVAVDVTNSSGSKILQSFNSLAQNTGEAFQFVDFTNDGSFNTTNFAFAYQLLNGPAPHFIRWVSQDDGGPGDPMAAGEGADTIYGHQAAADDVATAAVNYQTPTVPEPYSAVGGDNAILFDVNGNRLATPDIRPKPDITGPDNVDTTFFIPGNDTDNSGFPNFQGTSAATPHTAGAAALEIAANPGNGPAAIVGLLEETAKDIQAPGFDFNTGFGLLQLVPGVGPGPGPVQPSNLPDDQFEFNDTSDRATNFGTLSGSLSFSGLTINVHPSTGLPDYDWYRMTMSTAGTFTATITDVPERGDIELHLFTITGTNTLTELSNSETPGQLTRTLTAAVQSGQVIFVEVKGHSPQQHVFGTGTYSMTLTLA
jgi:hypothetical protein